MTATEHDPTAVRPIHRVARELAASNGFLLARLGFKFKHQAMEAVEKSGFELYDYSVLAILAEGARETQATIADALAVDPSRLVAVLDSLGDRGLIQRERDPHDRRRHVVSITSQGKRQLAQLRATIHKVEAEFFDPLDAGEREQLHDALLRLAERNDPRCFFCPPTE